MNFDLRSLAFGFFLGTWSSVVSMLVGAWFGERAAKRRLAKKGVRS